MDARRPPFTTATIAATTTTAGAHVAGSMAGRAGKLPCRRPCPSPLALPNADDLLSDTPDASYLTHRPFAAAAAPSYVRG